jgi:hypothetical protein
MRMERGRRVDLLAAGAPDSDEEEAWVEWLQKEEWTPDHVYVRRTHFTGEGWSAQVDEEWQKSFPQFTTPSVVLVLFRLQGLLGFGVSL